MEPTVKNCLTNVSRQIVLAGLFKNYAPLPEPFATLADEMYDVPERPHDFPGQMPRARGSELAILVSGGLDSSLLYWMAQQQRRTPQCIYVDYGQPYMQKEVYALVDMGIQFENIDLGLDSALQGLYWKHIIPARNFLCLSVAAESIAGGEVWFGVMQGEMPSYGGDKSVSFVNRVNEIFAKLPMPVTVVTPLFQYTKEDAVRWFLNNGGDPRWLMRTVSCFTGGVASAIVSHCGQCQACLRKALAFVSNGLRLVTAVPVKVGCVQYIEKYKRLMGEALEKSDFSHYSERRCRQDLAAIERL